MVAVVWLLVPLGLSAQGYRHFTPDDGLPSARIYKIGQDKYGFIWIATDRGLTRYDGNEFVTFTTRNGLPTNDIWYFTITQNGKLWYFSRSKSLGYILRDSVYNFPLPDSVEVYPQAISTDKRRISFTSEKKRFDFVGNQWVSTTIPKVMDRDSVSLFVPVLHPGFAYLLYSGKGYLFLCDKNFNLKKTVRIPPGQSFMRGQINDSLITFRMIDKLYFFNLKDKQLHLIDNISTEKLTFLRVVSSDSCIQISYRGSWYRLGRNYRFADKKTFLPGKNVMQTFKDHRGNYWLATYNDGIYFIPRSYEQTSYYLQGHQINFIKRLDSDLYASSIGKGLYRYNPAKDVFEMYIPYKKYIFDIYKDPSGRFFLLGQWKLYEIRNGKMIPIEINGKKMVRFGNRYLITRTSDMIITDTTFRILKSYKMLNINALTGKQDTIYLGTASGLYGFVNDTIFPVTLPHYPVVTPVLSLYAAKDNLFVGTDGKGVFVSGKDSLRLLDERLRNTIVTDITARNDTIWFATNRGGFAYHRNRNGGYKFLGIYRKYDGLISDLVNQITFADGRLFSASNQGIASVTLIHDEPATLENLYFKSVTYGDKEFNTVPLRAKYQKNGILSVKFGILDFSGQEQYDYLMRLLPVQNSWRKTGGTTIAWNDLKPGEYRLEVMAVSPYGQEKVKTLPIEILPLWWQTTMAKIGFVLLFLGGMIFLLLWVRRYEIAKHERRLQMQKTMVEHELHALRSQMNPHFIFNSLNAIQYYLNDGKLKFSEKYLVKFSRLIRMIFETTRQKSIPLSEELSLLKSYLTLEKMRFDDKLNYEIVIDPHLDLNNTMIPSMLLQPVLENAINHGIFHKETPGTIRLEISRMNDQTFTVIISDDGIGLKKAMELKKKSLRKHLSRSGEILRERIRLLNDSGKWQIAYTIEDVSETDDRFSTRITFVIRKK